MESGSAAIRGWVLTENVTISLIGAATTVVLSVINLSFAMKSNRRGQRNEYHLVETKASVKQLAGQTNGIQAELLKVTGEAEFAKGLKQGEACR